MLKRLLVLDGVMAVAKFRDDGAFVEGYGVMPDAQLEGLARFAHEYKRMVQGNADQLSMFSQMRGWTPPGGWIVRGPAMSVLSVSNLVAVVNNAETSINEVMSELKDAANY
jgi:roadblock/LC7 domain-containing protein